MDKPNTADARPAVPGLEAGRHAFRTCGRSAGQSFCDGAHKNLG